MPLKQRFSIISAVSRCRNQIECLVVFIADVAAVVIVVALLKALPSLLLLQPCCLQYNSIHKPLITAHCKQWWCVLMKGKKPRRIMLQSHPEQYLTDTTILYGFYASNMLQIVGICPIQ
jgi:hypothetical protein